jgi:hypothetical protein
MWKNSLILSISLPLLLSGCIGTMMWGNTSYLDEQYPDIRTVPTRAEAIAPRCPCGGDEKVIRAQDLNLLQQDRKRMHERDKTLRAMEESLTVMPLPAPQGDPTPETNFEALQKELKDLKERDQKIREKIFK